MSLINQMLQDLDARRAAHGVGANLPNDVRPLPVQKSSRLPIALGGVVLLALVGGFAFYQWQIEQQAVPPATLAVPVAVVPSPVPPPVAEPVNIAPVEPLRMEPAPSVASTLPEAGTSLRMADFIEPPVDKKAEAKPVSAVPATLAPAAAKQPDERAKKEAAERLALVAPALLAQVPAKLAKPPMIERTEALGSPRERAESEYRKAIVAVNQGRVAESLDGLRNALRQDGFHVASRQLLAKLLLEAKQSDEAIQVLQDGLQGQPAQLGWAMSLARLQLDRGDLAGAWQTLNYSQPAAGNNADYQGFSAHVLQRLGRNKDAAERYQAAARLSPGDGRWWLGLGLSWEAEGRTSEAREAFARAKQSGNLSAELMAMIEQKLR